jgi:hypothetical protein
MSEMDIFGHGSPGARLRDVSSAGRDDVRIVRVARETGPTRTHNDWVDSDSDDDDLPTPMEGISNNRDQPVLARTGREVTFEDMFGSDNSGSD